MHFGGIISCLSQDVDDLSDRILGIFRPLGHFYYRLVTVLTAFQHITRDKDVIGECTVFGEQESIMLVHFQCTYKRFLCTFKDFYHFAFHLASLALGGERDFHLVPMHGMAGVTFGYENRFASVFRYECILTIAFSLEFSSQDDAVVIQLEVSVFHYLNEVVFRHLVKNVHAKHF